MTIVCNTATYLKIVYPARHAYNASQYCHVSCFVVDDFAAGMRFTIVVKNFYAARNQKFIQLKRLYNIYSLFSAVDYLKNIYEEPEAIVLFGSYSKGEDISQSDIDIAVITSNHKEIKISKFEKKLTRKIKIYEIQIEKAEKEFLNTLINGIVLDGYLNIIK